MLMHMDAVATYILSMGLLVILLLVWLVHKQRTGQGFVLWLASGLVGILLGSVGSFAVVCASGLIITAVPKPLPADAQAGTAAAQMAASTPPASGTPPAGGMGGGGMGGMGMGGGGRGPNPKRDLTTLVRKLNLLTDDISLQLTPEQTTALLKGLNGVDAAEKFSDDDAKKMYEELFAILNDDQKAKLDVIGLPFGRGAGGGGGGMGGGGMGGGQPDPDANPFQQENNLKALKSFRGRFAPAGS